MGILLLLVWAILAAAILRAQLPRYSGEEQRLLQLGLILSIVFSVLNVWVVSNLLGGGDMLWYHKVGGQLADLWRKDPQRWTPELLKLTFRIRTEFPFWVHGVEGSSTGAMFGISAWLMLLHAKSLHAAAMLLALLNYFSRLLIYRVFRAFVPENYRIYLLIGVILLPSTMFWTGGLLKESFAMTGMGIAVAGAYYLAERSDFVRGVALIALGGLTAYLVKPYVLFPFFVAAPVWYLMARLRDDGRDMGVLMTPMRLIIFGGLLAAGLILLAYLVPSLGVEQLGDELASVQSAGTTRAGATNYQLVSAETVATRGRTAQLVMAPFAFLFALTRPWPFEARSGQTLVAMVEIFLLSLLLFRSIRTIGLMDWFRRVLARPWLVFCVTYLIIFGTAVGLGSTNLGSLSRYRVPMMMFYGALVAVSYGWVSLPETAQSSAHDGADSTVVMTQRMANGRKRPFRIYRPARDVVRAIREPANRNKMRRVTPQNRCKTNSRASRRAPLRVRRVQTQINPRHEHRLNLRKPSTKT